MEREKREWAMLFAISGRPIRAQEIAAALGIHRGALHRWLRMRLHYSWLSISYPGKDRGTARFVIGQYVIRVLPLSEQPPHVAQLSQTVEGTEQPPQVARPAAPNQIIIQDFMRNLRQEITRRRKENHDERHRKHWNPEAIVMRFQTDLIEYIEDQLDIVTDVINVIVAAERIKLERAAKQSHIGKKRKKKHVQKSKSNGHTTDVGIGEGIR